MAVVSRLVAPADNPNGAYYDVVSTETIVTEKVVKRFDVDGNEVELGGGA